jgi:hypothetical protein
MKKNYEQLQQSNEESENVGFRTFMYFRKVQPESAGVIDQEANKKTTTNIFDDSKLFLNSSLHNMNQMAINGCARFPNIV